MLKLSEGRRVDISAWLRKDATVLYISSKAPVSCRTNQHLIDVIPVLAEQYRRLPVLDREGRVRGVISSTDVLRAVSGLGKKRRSTMPVTDMKVRALMSPRVLEMNKNMKLGEVLDFFRRHRRGAYPVVYRKGLVGVVSEWDIVRQIKHNTGIKISDVMVKRPMVAQQYHSVADVARMLSVGGFRRLPVVKNGILVGIVTPRDVLTFLYRNGLINELQSQKQEVHSMMNRSVVTISPSADLHDAVRIMISRKIGGMPVVEDHELTGIITERDIVDILTYSHL